MGTPLRSVGWKLVAQSGAHMPPGVTSSHQARSATSPHVSWGRCIAESTPSTPCSGHKSDPVPTARTVCRQQLPRSRPIRERARFDRLTTVHAGHGPTADCVTGSRGLPRRTVGHRFAAFTQDPARTAWERGPDRPRRAECAQHRTDSQPAVAPRYLSTGRDTYRQPVVTQRRRRAMRMSSVSAVTDNASPNASSRPFQGFSSKARPPK